MIETVEFGLPADLDNQDTADSPPGLFRMTRLMAVSELSDYVTRNSKWYVGIAEWLIARLHYSDPPMRSTRKQDLQRMSLLRAKVLNDELPAFSEIEMIILCAFNSATIMEGNFVNVRCKKCKKEYRPDECRFLNCDATHSKTKMIKCSSAHVLFERPCYENEPVDV